MGSQKNKKKSIDKKHKTLNTKSKPINKFELHLNRVKHDVVGRKKWEDVGLPGIARAKANKKRERTLLQEYKVRHKSNIFVDRRIGENDARMDPEKKMALRLAAEKKHQFSKKSIFNLNEDEELTHGGLALNDANINEKLDDSDGEEDMLDAKFVKEQHFGGGFLKAVKEGEEGRHSRKEWIDEIIAESKKKKDESRKEKEEQEEAVTQLDSGFQQFLTLMSGQKLTDTDKESSKKTCEFRDYDFLVKEMLFDRSKKATAVDRLKTPEELVKEERERLEKLEDDRNRRMKGVEDRVVSTQGGRSADDLCDGFAMEEKDSFVISYHDGKILALEKRFEEIEGIEKEENEDSEDEKQVSDEDESEEEKEDSDQFSDLLSDEESEDEQEEAKKKQKKIYKNEKLARMEAAKKEIPFTFKVPAEYDDFWLLLNCRSPSQVSLIIARMITCNHPSLGGENKSRCEDLFNYLLQAVHVLSEVESESPSDEFSSLSYIEPILPHLFTLTQLSSDHAAQAFISVMEEKYEEFAQKRKGIHYPYADTFIFLKLASVLFPISDFQHPVTTPAIVFVCHVLGSAKVTGRREVTAALFASNLMLEYLSFSRRYVPELNTVLNGILWMCLPGEKTDLPCFPPFTKVGKERNLLAVDEIQEELNETSPVRFTLASLNEQNDDPITDSFKTAAAAECLRLLQLLCSLWRQMQSVCAVFEPTHRLLEHLPVKSLPTAIGERAAALSNMISDLPETRRRLQKAQGRPKPMKMYDAVQEKIIDGVRKHPGGSNHEFQERQKLVHKIRRERKGARREIQRDTAFLARQRLQETMLGDAERKRKVAQIMSGLSLQECEHKKWKKQKK